MSISMSAWMLASVVIISVMAGFWIGRSMKWMAEDTERQAEETIRLEKRVAVGREIGSPISGEVRSCQEGERVGALIKPKENILYAPAAGKIIKLFPMGNAMILRTDYGTELYMRVGEYVDELSSAFFRSRIVQNEIVGKGKALLEFDAEGLQAQGKQYRQCKADELGDDGA